MSRWSSMITVSTVRDRAGAELAKEALRAVGIAAEVRLVGQNPYFGSVSAEEYEVRVPEDDEPAARSELDRLAGELEQAVYAEAGVPADEESDALTPPEQRPRKPSWAFVISLLLPFPGGGCMYARASKVGFVLLGIWLGVTLALVSGMHSPHGGTLWVGAKLIDALLGPLFAIRYNRRLAAAKH
jgi:hypothetical protein